MLKILIRAIIVLAMVVIGLGIIGSQMEPTSNRLPDTEAHVEPAPAAKPVATIDKSDEMQEGRKALIEKLIKNGIFQKVEIGNYANAIPRVYVRPAFYALDFDEKQKFLGVVYAYHHDGSDELAMVRVRDARSGKDVGMLQSTGLTMD